MLLVANRGNLVFNGGFEQGLAGWAGVCNVELESQIHAHEGTIVAAMGKPDNTLAATMHQDVPVIPKCTYKLQLFVAGVDLAPADLWVDVRWVNAVGDDLGTALPTPTPVFVPKTTTGSANTGAFKAVIAYTTQAPFAAVRARILLSKAPGSVESNFLLVDNVIFEKQG